MVASLPPNIQLKLQQTLLQWRHWHCDPALLGRPELISRLGEGISNFSVLVEAQQQFVVRIDGMHAAANALSRSTEWRALATAYANDLAPCPRYYNPELGTLVCDFLPPDCAHKESIEEVAGLLRAIHHLPALHHRLDLGDRVRRYESMAEHHGAQRPAKMAVCRTIVLPVLENLKREREPLVFCHNDLLRANRIVSSGTIRAIDWEYCAMGNPWFDLAVVVVGDELNAAQAGQLTDAYLQRPATAEEQLKLGQYGLVYRYLEILWYLVNKPESVELSSRVSKLQLLCAVHQ